MLETEKRYYRKNIIAKVFGESRASPSKLCGYGRWKLRPANARRGDELQPQIIQLIINRRNC